VTGIFADKHTGMGWRYRRAGSDCPSSVWSPRRRSSSAPCSHRAWSDA